MSVYERVKSQYMREVIACEACLERLEVQTDRSERMEYDKGLLRLQVQLLKEFLIYWEELYEAEEVPEKG